MPNSVNDMKRKVRRYVDQAYEDHIQMDDNEAYEKAHI